MGIPCMLGTPSRTSISRFEALKPSHYLPLTYFQYLKMKKPTGNVTCLPEVKCMHELEDLINQHIGTHDISDSKFINSDDGSPDDNIKIVENPSASVCTSGKHKVVT